MASTSCKVSSGDDGFFQVIPVVKNQFHEDISFQRIMKFFLPQEVNNAIALQLEQFGEEILSRKIFGWVTDAERNLPYLKGSGRDAFGRRTSELVVSEGWQQLQNFGITNGIVAAGYDRKNGEYARIVQFLKTQLWTGSCANVTCPSAMTDGAAKLLSSHLSSKALDQVTRDVFQDAYDRLTSRDSQYAWTSGQWMTERSGGSDVSGTETVATFSPGPAGTSASGQPLGPWSIDGFKWFSSATDSSMTVLLAQTPKGLSAFFAPMYRMVDGSITEKELNGVYIQRLKNKSGTKSLPTAELELRGMRGYLIGREGQGIHQISMILNITRLYSAVSTVGYVGRGFAIAKAFARVREVGAGKGTRVALFNAPLHMNTMAKLATDYHAMMLFTFFVAWMIGIDENGSKTGLAPSQCLQPEVADVSQLLRVLTPILKGAVCKRSSHILQECMEALGGVGYLDNSENESINIARLYRDCIVNSIWEGTTEVLATDALRVLKGKNGHEVIASLDRWITKTLTSPGRNLDSDFARMKEAISEIWSALKNLITTCSAETLLPSAHDLLFQIADVVMSVLLVADVEADASEAGKQMCRYFLQQKRTFGGRYSDGKQGSLKLDQEIVFGRIPMALL